VPTPLFEQTATVQQIEQKPWCALEAKSIDLLD